MNIVSFRIRLVGAAILASFRRFVIDLPDRVRIQAGSRQRFRRGRSGRNQILREARLVLVFPRVMFSISVVRFGFDQYYRGTADRLRFLLFAFSTYEIERHVHD